MEIVRRKIADLKHAEYNPRFMTHNQFEAIKKSLENFEQVVPIVVNMHPKRKNVIIGGHQRCTVLEQMGIDEVDTVEVNLTLKSEKELNIRLNKNNGSWDWDMLANNFLEEDLIDWGFSESELDMFADDPEPEDIEEDDFNEDPPEKPITKLGDVYQLGPHRLMCGDSTSEDAVRDLLEKNTADMTFTDPPYLMDFKGNVSWDEKEGAQKTFNAVHGGILNDKMSKEEGEDFLDKINQNIKLFVKGAFYITFYRLGIDKYYESLNRVGLQCRSLIIWNKGNHTLSNSDYMSKYEPIFYGWVKDHNFYGGKNGMDIWDIKRTLKNDLHPTMKPLELCAKAIQDGSKKGEVVLDLFGGSGSTLIACDKVGRKARVMELDPKYCDVIVKRYCNLKDIEPDKVFESKVAE